LRRKAPRRRLCPVKRLISKAAKLLFRRAARALGPKALFLLAPRQCAGF